MSDYKLNPLDCPEDRIYIFDPSQVQRGDLSALPIEELLEVQGDINRMMELMRLSHSQGVDPRPDVFDLHP